MNTKAAHFRKYIDPFSDAFTKTPSGAGVGGVSIPAHKGGAA